jgi:hypothetical protein
VRRDTQESYTEYLKRLAEAELWPGKHDLDTDLGFTFSAGRVFQTERTPSWLSACRKTKFAESASARMRSGVSKGGGNASLAGEKGRYGEA